MLPCQTSFSTAQVMFSSWVGVVYWAVQHGTLIKGSETGISIVQTRDNGTAVSCLNIYLLSAVLSCK